MQFNPRDLFNCSTRWGCANTITKLDTGTCPGTNCAAVAAYVAAGVFGSLKWLSVLNSGYEDSQITQTLVVNLPNWQIRVLDRLDLDHCDDWEVAALAAIHVKKLNTTRVFPKAIIDAFQLGWVAEGAGLRVDRLGDESVPGVPELKRACETRNDLLEIGAVPRLLHYS